jgi:Mn-dependent DtxR family transcriptional regulator
MANVDQLGSTAGAVWKYLRENGPASLSAIERGLEESKPMVAMAVGWLAREGKVTFQQEKRGVMISLSE